MGKPNFSDEFKRDAVAQITNRGYSVAEVSQRLGISVYAKIPGRPGMTATKSMATGSCTMT